MKKQAKLKLSPVRIRVPKYGNGLMLLMEFATRYYGGSTSFLGHVTDQEEGYFDIEIRVANHVARDVREYINLNL